MSQIGILLWIKAAPKENLATQFILQARSGIKIANLLKYSFGPRLLKCGDVAAAASNISWAFPPPQGQDGDFQPRPQHKEAPYGNQEGKHQNGGCKASGCSCSVTNQDSCHQHILVLSTDWTDWTHSQVSPSAEQHPTIPPLPQPVLKAAT